ncbi:glycosyl transferase family 1 [Bradyrhizobium ottawaense]|uniref:glycosyltransferase family 4 protein n=1 Tax=Bradyrhizobium ottawaense TaxID=931866 RepID=UPI000BE83F2D|nr:glycosyltransferase family 4 protein [Bradyrhizobium ottawaense]PDT64971.1 glycosyl transferase family 1 [Bradyrhizobium ottawaense]
MRILHLYKTHLPDTYGGIPQFIDQLARGVARRGHTVDVLFPSRQRPLHASKLANYTSHPVPLHLELASTSISLSVFKKFKELAGQADIIHYHFPWPLMDLVHLTALTSKPSIVTYHSDVVRQRVGLWLYRPLMKRFLDSVDRVVATSPNYCATSETLRNYASKTRSIPIGVDQSTYPQPAAHVVEKWRARVGDQFFLFVGGLRYYKGLHILLEAVKGTDIPVVIVGTGPVERRLHEQAKRYDLSNVKLLGEVSDEDKAALLTLCNAFVFPSHLRSEAFGISLLEGAMYGKPMISAEIGTGTSFVNIDRQTGLVVPPSDANALRGAMTYLAENPLAGKRMGQNARRRYETLFTADLMVQRYLDLYHEMLCERNEGEGRAQA